MKILLDMNLPPKLARLLSDMGIETTHCRGAQCAPRGNLENGYICLVDMGAQCAPLQYTTNIMD